MPLMRSKLLNSWTFWSNYNSKSQCNIRCRMQSLHCTTLLAMIGRVSQNCFLSCIMFAEFATAAGGPRPFLIAHPVLCLGWQLVVAGWHNEHLLRFLIVSRWWMWTVGVCRCLLASRALRSADGFNGDQFPNVNSSPVNVRLLAVAWSVIQKYAFNVSSHFLEAAFWFFNDAKCAFTQMI